MNAVIYNYALAEHGNYVHIKHVNVEERLLHHYFCIGCGAEMIPKKGKKRAWHFAHKGDDEHCNRETYLHKLAKRLIKEAFDKACQFNFQYYRDVKCSSASTCPFYYADICHCMKLKSVNLKEYYDTCEEEQAIGGFVADLLLTSSTKPDTPPVLIEVFVFHESTEEKRCSGYRIIEVTIRSEEDIQRLIEEPIVESSVSSISFEQNSSKGDLVTVYGFRRDLGETMPLNQRHIPKFYLFKSGKAYVSNMDDIKYCRDAQQKENEWSIFEASIDSDYLCSPSPYDYGFIIARLNGFKTKTCQLCKYYRNGYEVGLGLDPIFCCLYKKYGTPMNPEAHFANQCEYYSEDQERIKVIQETMPSYQIAVQQNISNNHNNYNIQKQ